MECQQLVAERRTVALEENIERRSSDVEEQLCKYVAVFERRTSTLESTSEQLGSRTSVLERLLESHTSTLESTSEQLGTRTSALERLLESHTSTLESTNEELDGRTTALESRTATLESTSEQLGSRTTALESSKQLQLECRTSTLESASRQLDNRAPVLEASDRQLGNHTTSNKRFDSHASAIEQPGNHTSVLETVKSVVRNQGGRLSALENSFELLDSRTLTLESAIRQLNSTSTLGSALQQLDSDLSAHATPSQQLASTSSQQLHGPPVVDSLSSPLEGIAGQAAQSSDLRNRVQKCEQDVQGLEKVLKTQLESVYEKVQKYDSRLQKVELALDKLQSFDERLRKLELATGNHN